MTVRGWLYRRGIHTHTVCDDEHGQLWRYGRIYAHVYDRHADSDDARKRFDLNLSWHFRLRNAWALEVGVGGGDSDRDLQLHADLFGAAVWLTYDGLPRHLCERILPGHNYTSPSDGRTIRITEPTRTGLDWHDGVLWWHGWANDMSWKSTDRWWTCWTFHPADFFLGKQKYHRETLKTEHVNIPLDGKSYPAVVKLDAATWKRPRWFAKHMRLATVDVEHPPTFPGKGENSWDIDDDMIFSLSCPARTVAEAVGHYITSVMQSRERYGGRFDWQPEVAS